jgi:hypothetical protein
LKCRLPDVRENKLHLGQYPTLSLADARTRRDELRRQIANGIYPVVAQRA